MAVEIDTRKVQSPSATEIYISAAPKDCAPTQSEIEELFAGIQEKLVSEEASILQERIFTVDGSLDIVSAARSRAYGKMDDGVAPSLLTGRQGRHGSIAGVQVHAVACSSRPEVVRLDGKACGRMVKLPGRAYVTLSGISGGKSGNAVSRPG